MNNMSWAEKNARLADEYGTARKAGEQAKELLKYSDTNRRINSVIQAQWAMAVRMAVMAIVAESKKPLESIELWKPFLTIADMTEKYQLTLDGKQDSRNEYIEAISALAKANNDKNKGQLSITTQSGGQEE
jgi:hypothetical protein